MDRQNLKRKVRLLSKSEVLNIAELNWKNGKELESIIRREVPEVVTTLDQQEGFRLTVTSPNTEIYQKAEEFINNRLKLGGLQTFNKPAKTTFRPNLNRIIIERNY